MHKKIKEGKKNTAVIDIVLEFISQIGLRTKIFSFSAFNLSNILLIFSFTLSDAYVSYALT